MAFENLDSKALFDIGWKVLSAIIAFVFLVYNWWIQKNKVSSRHIEAAKKECNERISKQDSHLLEHQERLVKIEGRLATMPSHSDLKSLREDIVANGKSTERMIGQMGRMITSLDRLEKYLLERNK